MCSVPTVAAAATTTDASSVVATTSWHTSRSDHGSCLIGVLSVVEANGYGCGADGTAARHLASLQVLQSSFPLCRTVQRGLSSSQFLVFLVLQLLLLVCLPQRIQSLHLFSDQADLLQLLRPLGFVTELCFPDNTINQ